MSRLNRRTFITTGIAAGSALAIPGAAAGTRSRALRQDPFQIGIASGEPTPTGVVLWTRLAPAPLDPDGGMGSREVPVQWELATDEKFSSVIARGEEVAIPGEGHSVHAEAKGLPAGAELFYRFKAESYVSEVGRTRTAPSGEVSSMTACIASCQHLETGWYHAHRFLAADEPDVVFFLGDYMYEKRHEGDTVRKYLETDEVDKLHEYRMRYAQHRTDPDLRSAHAIAPWIVVFDDHEVVNNWYGEDSAESAARLQSAFQAFWENQPLPKAMKPVDSSIPLYRRLSWGNLANLHMMDTRQYRSAQVEDDDCDAIEDPQRTLIGAEQEQWLLDGLASSGAMWDVLGQQVFFALRDNDGDAATCDRSTDAWDGYSESRNRVTEGLTGVRNPLILTGDVHTAWANNVKQDYFDEASPTIASELVTTSITSPGSAPSDDMLAVNPHVNFVSSERGYTRMTVDPARVKAEFLAVSSVYEPDPSKVSRNVVATYVIQDGVPGVEPV